MEAEKNTDKMEPLLRAEEVAELLNVAPSTVRGWVYKDMIPYVALGGSVRFRIEDIARIQQEGLPQRNKEEG